MTKPPADQISQPPEATVSGEQATQPQPQVVEKVPFSKRRTKSEFITWVEGWFQSKATLAGITSVLERNRDDKLMYEEAAPVYYYVGRFYKDRSDIQVELSGDSRKGDGQILNSDGTLIEHVEITMPFAPTDHAERKQLGAGLTLADFYGSFEMYSLDESVKLIDAALTKKLANKYPDQTVLLVVMPPGMVAEADDEKFNQILKKLKPIPSTSQFRRILVMECGGAFWRELPPSSTGASA